MPHSHRLLFVCYAFLVQAHLVYSEAEARAGWAVLYDKNGYLTRDIPDEALERLDTLAKQGAELRSIAFMPNGGWVILYDKSGYSTSKVPDEAFQRLETFAKQGAELKSIAFTPNGGWAILYNKNGYSTRNIPDEAFERLGTLAKQGVELKSIAFTPGGGWAVVSDKHGYFTRNIPDGTFKKLGELATQDAEIRTITFTAGGGWSVLFNKNGYVARGIPDDAFKAVANLANKGAMVKSLTFTVDPPLSKLSQDDNATRDKILERMAHDNVPGMSVAVSVDHKIAFVRSYGSIQSGGGKPVKEETRFQAASISKTLAATAAMRLVQDGKIGLDGEINQYLVSWKIPINKFTEQKQPTVRQVLTHSAGFNIHGFDGYAAGRKVPSLLQVLDGKSPANSPAIRVEFLPGSKVQYSGGGFCVLQQTLCDINGQPFDKLMHELVLEPAGMKNSTFDQPLPKSFESITAVGSQKGSAVPGKWHTYPEMAAAGLWTTSSDLARFTIAIQRSTKGHSDAILSAKLAKEMLTPQIGDRGLGFVVTGQGKHLVFSHNGINAGFESQLFASVETGHGVVVMTNANDARKLIDEVVQAVRTEFGW